MKIFLLHGWNSVIGGVKPTYLGDHRPEAVLGDKGYDTDKLAAAIETRGAEVVIPPKKNRVEPREYDEVVYKERNKVERCATGSSSSAAWPPATRRYLGISWGGAVRGLHDLAEVKTTMRAAWINTA